MEFKSLMGKMVVMGMSNVKFHMVRSKPMCSGFYANKEILTALFKVTVTGYFPSVAHEAGVSV